MLVPLPPDEALSRAERAKLQRETARIALRHSAVRCGAAVVEWPQREDGVPMPTGGWHWSVSHTRRWAAAVVAPCPIGIDVEWIRPRKEMLWDGVADADEWRRFGERSWDAFFRLWTAKEATLKAHGKGIGYLSDAKLIAVPDVASMVIDLRGDSHRVLQLRIDDHIAAVSPVAGPVEWLVHTGSPAIPQHE